MTTTLCAVRARACRGIGAHGARADPDVDDRARQDDVRDRASRGCVGADGLLVDCDGWICSLRWISEMDGNADLRRMIRRECGDGCG